MSEQAPRDLHATTANQAPLVLVTGATGAIGPLLVERLVEEGYKIRALVRRPITGGILPEGIEFVHGDVTDQHAVAQALYGVDIVYHLAAKLHISNPSPEMSAEYERINVEGTRHVVEAAQAAGVQRMVFFSTIAVYGPTGLRPVDETSTPCPDSLYADTKLRGEQICLRASNSAGEPLAVVLRLSAVYGPGMKGNYAKLVDALARGRFISVGRGDNLRTLIYCRDAVDAAITASRHAKAAGAVYNVADGTTHTLADIISAICEALGRRPPRIFVPLRFARAAAAIVDAAWVAADRRGVWVAAVEKLAETVSVRSDRIRLELGFQPAYDLQRGWTETVAALRRSKTVG